MIRPKGGFPKPWRESQEYFIKYRGIELPTDYRGAAGPVALWDIKTVMQFNLLTMLGLREHHYVLDIGCGSLRVGRLLIPYLLPGRYYGIDPMEWMMEAAIANEIGEDMVRIKRPVLSNDEGLNLSAFGQNFDFLLAQSVLPHLSRPMVEKCLAEAAKVMRKDESIFAATYVRGDADCQDNEWGARHDAHYRWETVREMAGKNGLVCHEIGWPHGGQRWILFTFPSFTDEALRRAGNPIGQLARMLS